MPVEKFHSLNEAREALEKRAATIPVISRFRAVNAITAVFSPHRALPGVTKFRSVEDANRAREEQERSQAPGRPGSEGESRGPNGQRS